MIIRAAESVDMEAIRSLYRMLFANLARIEPAYFRPAEVGEEFLRECVQSDKADVLLAEEDGVIIGFALVRELQALPYNCMVPHTFAELTDISVNPSAQGEGVGTALLAAAKEWARARGLDYVELSVLDQNTGAMRLYEREGFRSVQRCMRFPL